MPLQALVPPTQRQKILKKDIKEQGKGHRNVTARSKTL